MKKKYAQSFKNMAVILLLSAVVPAQSGGTFLIEKSVIAGGGGSAAGGTFALDGTIGQSFAGTMSSGGVFSVDSGFWAGLAAPTTISGAVTYGNAMGSPAPPRFISSVTLTGSGSPTVMTTTGAPGVTAGQYALSGFGSGSYTVTPTKTGGVNGAISSFDAGRIALHVAGPPNPQLTANQLIVADVSGNGSVSSFDAGMIAKFVAGPPYVTPGIGATGTWRFTPANRPYATVTTNINGEDYTAILMGEVSGNWVNPATRPDDNGVSGPMSISASNVNGTVTSDANTAADNSSTGATGAAISVSLPRLDAAVGTEIVVPVEARGVAGKSIIAYEFDIRYDPSVLRPQLKTVDLVGTASRSLTPVVNAVEPGLLRVVAYGASAIAEDGILLNLKFTAVGTSGASAIVWERVMFNEGGWPINAANGEVRLSHQVKE